MRLARRKGENTEETLDQATTPSALSLGDDACRFRVGRTGNPLAPCIGKLDPRFKGGQATG